MAWDRTAAFWTDTAGAGKSGAWLGLATLGAHGTWAARLAHVGAASEKEGVVRCCTGTLWAVSGKGGGVGAS
jgi:hypothetical protein